MFKKNDPLVDSVRAVMEVSEFDRQIEAAVNEEFGVTSKNALPRELKHVYEQRLAEAKKCAMDEKVHPSKYSEKQKRLAHLGNRTGHGGDPKKIDAPDLKAVRKVGHIEEEGMAKALASKVKDVVSGAGKAIGDKEGEMDTLHDKATKFGSEMLKNMGVKPETIAGAKELADKAYKTGKSTVKDSLKEKWHEEAKYAPGKKPLTTPAKGAKKAIEEDQLNEKAKSEQQQKFFGLVRAIQKGKAHGSEKAEKAAKEMSVKSVRDYAKTKHEGLPKKVDEQALWEEIKSNLEEQLISVYESGDEAAFANFVGGLTEEQLAILGLNEAPMDMSLGKPSRLTQWFGTDRPGYSSAPDTTKMNVPGSTPKGTFAGAEMEKAGEKASFQAKSNKPIDTSPAGAGSLSRQTGGEKPILSTAASSSTPSVASAPNFSKPGVSAADVAAGKNPIPVDQEAAKTARYKELQSKGFKFSGSQTPAGAKIAPQVAAVRTGTTAPTSTASVSKPAGKPAAPRTAMRPSAPRSGAAASKFMGTAGAGMSAGDITRRSLGGMNEQTKPQLKESFEQFLRNRFLKD